MGGAAVEGLPGWVTLLRAPNPGPMTLDGTNTWVLRAPGAAEAMVIDPGPLDDGHLAAIAAHAPLSSILVTHGHHDHVDGAAKLSRLLGAVPVRAADPRHCLDADPLTAGPLTEAGLTIEVLATPGHTADSVCFLTSEAVFTGDSILGHGTAVVAWPDGDLGAYLTTLRTLSAYPRVVLPGHGPALPDCGAIARAYLAHRQQRLTQVREAVAAGANTAEAIVDAVYTDLDPRVRFAAVWSARAQLDYLRRESPPGSEQLDPL
ncbi:MAG TPA: MBL fold metallo-hydrolase [Actinoplanes sp.]|nr:MBL fold metallo-hydrolase [Actinoplanes sp.]